LVEDARTDVLLALRVQVLAERGCTNGQIAARLGASTAAVHVAFARLRRVRLLDRDDEL
jgi:DNA-binding IclR family transcriptional regulator